MYRPSSYHDPIEAEFLTQHKDRWKQEDEALAAYEGEAEFIHGGPNTCLPGEDANRDYHDRYLGVPEF